MRVAFIHPDLGIGGAERAVIDAAIALQSSGHQVAFFTGYHDPGHSFPETTDGSLAVYSAGQFIPRHFLGMFMIFFAMLKISFVTLYFLWFYGGEFDVVFCDQISLVALIVKMLGLHRVIFYCHYPDLLLSSRTDNNWLKKTLKQIYRFPFDKLEEMSTGVADRILVNSKFTKHVVQETFPSIAHREMPVVYPVPNLDKLDHPGDPIDGINGGRFSFFLSINRFERKKNVILALEAFGLFKKMIKNGENFKLVLMGGYDERLEDSVRYLTEIRDLTEKLDLNESVHIVTNGSDSLKRYLLQNALSLLYTPANEHFGIVPVEAMYLRCPVIAIDSGGPKETVIDGETGFLCPQTADSFAQKMVDLSSNDDMLCVMRDNARAHVIANFAFAEYTKKLNNILLQL